MKRTASVSLGLHVMSVFPQDVEVRPEPSSASRWVSQWEQSSTALTTRVRVD